MGRFAGASSAGFPAHSFKVVNFMNYFRAPGAHLFAGAALALLATLSFPAAAHVTLEYQVANAGSYYKATFKVGHGCGASPTRQLIVMVPEGVQGARPMPKAGWAIEITREKRALPGAGAGSEATEDVSRISWTARTPADYLPGNYYDEFSLQGKLPASEGAMYWGVSQVCESGRQDWTETPQADQDPAALKSPAALLDILPASGSGGHHH